MKVHLDYRRPGSLPLFQRPGDLARLKILLRLNDLVIRNKGTAATRARIGTLEDTDDGCEGKGRTQEDGESRSEHDQSRR
jgi:hypothetical protein